MNISRSFYNFVFLFCVHQCIIPTVTTVIIPHPNQPNISVTVFTQSYFRGVNSTLNISTCSINLHNHTTLGGNISSINSRGHCVNLYKTANCQGEYIVIKPGTPIHYDLSAWKGGFYKNVNSIGPCFTRCDPRGLSEKVEKAKGNGTHSLTHLVTLYDDSGYKGAHTTLDILLGQCHLIPLKLKRRISSVQVHGNFCIELHHTWNCDSASGSKFTQLRPNSPKHTDLIHWVGHDNQAVAVSLCGFDCNNATSGTKSEPQSSSGANRTETVAVVGVGNDTVTIFDDDEAFFKGHFKNLNFTSHDNKCFNLDGDWDGHLNTLNPWGHCVILYDEFNCSDSTGVGKNLTIPANITEAEMASFLRSHKFDRVAQSLKLCSLDAVPKNVNSTPAPITQSKLVGIKTSGKSIFFIVMFSLVTVSLVSVGLAFVVKRFLNSGGFGFNRRGRGSGGSHSLMF